MNKKIIIKKNFLLTVRFFKALSLIPIAFGSVLSVSADEYNFEEFKFDQVEIKQDIYEPKDKLDEYIIKGATYSTKFVPLMNDGAEGSESVSYTHLTLPTTPYV